MKRKKKRFMSTVIRSYSTQNHTGPSLWLRQNILPQKCLFARNLPPDTPKKTVLWIGRTTCIYQILCFLSLYHFYPLSEAYKWYADGVLQLNLCWTNPISSRGWRICLFFWDIYFLQSRKQILKTHFRNIFNKFPPYQEKAVIPSKVSISHISQGRLLGWGRDFSHFLVKSLQEAKIRLLQYASLS